MKKRLAKFLAECGVASRRKAEQLIIAGKVKLNDQIITRVATLIDSDKDKILVNDKPVKNIDKVYYLLNKPIGYICSKSDPHNKKSVINLVPKSPAVYPVGRLDKNSKGLLLLTNDGELTYQLTHPKFEIAKKYLVKVDKDLDTSIINILKQGVRLEEGLAKADKVSLKSKRELVIVLHQGWKRQIRRMLKELKYTVTELTRLEEGKLTLNNLQVGKYREIKKSDII